MAESDTIELSPVPQGPSTDRPDHRSTGQVQHEAPIRPDPVQAQHLPLGVKSSPSLSIGSTTSATTASLHQGDLPDNVGNAAPPSGTNTNPVMVPGGAPNNGMLRAGPYGIAQAKALFDWVDLGAVVVSMLALAVTVCAVTPQVEWAWWLGFQNQLIVLGAMLSLMNLCLMRVLPPLFVLLERHLGPSHLQNYEAILANSLLTPKSSMVWRTVLLLVMVIPAALGAGYKKFLGGISSHSPIALFDNRYGAVPLPMLRSYAATSPLFLAFNATIPFSIVSVANDAVPSPANLPAPFGYNNLLINTSSAAMLDLPEPDYLQEIQQSLQEGESWELSADVNGIVTAFDADTTYRDNDTLWTEFYDQHLLGTNGLSSWQLFNGYDLGVIVGTKGDPLRAFCLAGFDNGTANGESEYSANQTDSELFRRSAMLFWSERRQCRATWSITQSNIRLMQGSCQGQLTNQTVFTNSIPFALDAMPVLVHALTEFSPGRSQASSPWLMPTFAVNIAAMQWSRMVWMNGGSSAGLAPGIYQPPHNQPELYYAADNESYVSYRATMDPRAGLYVILALQPLLTLIAFLVPMFSYSTPIGRGFGLVTLLAGLDRDSAAILSGAAFSGALRRAMRLAIFVEGAGHREGQVRYSLLPSIAGPAEGKVQWRRKYR